MPSVGHLGRKADAAVASSAVRPGLPYPSGEARWGPLAVWSCRRFRPGIVPASGRRRWAALTTCESDRLLRCTAAAGGANRRRTTSDVQETIQQAGLWSKSSWSSPSSFRRPARRHKWPGGCTKGPVPKPLKQLGAGDPIPFTAGVSHGRDPGPPPRMGPRCPLPDQLALEKSYSGTAIGTTWRTRGCQPAARGAALPLVPDGAAPTGSIRREPRRSATTPPARVRRIVIDSGYARCRRIPGKFHRQADPRRT